MISRIVPVVLILIAFGLFFGYVNPTYTQSVLPLRAEIAGYDSALAASKEFKEKESELEAQKAALDPEDENRIEAFLPDSVDNVQLILDLNSLASRSGISLSNFDTKTVAPDQGGDHLPLSSDSTVDSLDITVSGIGTYQSFKTFLTAAEQSLRPLDLTDLTVEVSPTGVYTYDMTFRIYWLR